MVGRLNRNGPARSVTLSKRAVCPAARASSLGRAASLDRCASGADPQQPGRPPCGTRRNGPEIRGAPPTFAKAKTGTPGSSWFSGYQVAGRASSSSATTPSLTIPAERRLSFGTTREAAGSGSHAAGGACNADSSPAKSHRSFTRIAASPGYCDTVGQTPGYQLATTTSIARNRVPHRGTRAFRLDSWTRTAPSSLVRLRWLFPRRGHGLQCVELVSPEKPPVGNDGANAPGVADVFKRT